VLKCDDPRRRESGRKWPGEEGDGVGNGEVEGGRGTYCGDRGRRDGVHFGLRSKAFFRVDQPLDVKDTDDRRMLRGPSGHRYEVNE
jgi:hypothetical protein